MGDLDSKRDRRGDPRHPFIAWLEGVNAGERFGGPG